MSDICGLFEAGIGNNKGTTALQSSILKRKTAFQSFLLRILSDV
jgi:hypothetical protein